MVPKLTATFGDKTLYSHCCFAPAGYLFCVAVTLCGNKTDTTQYQNNLIDISTNNTRFDQSPSPVLLIDDVTQHPYISMCNQCCASSTCINCTFSTSVCSFIPTRYASHHHSLFSRDMPFRTNSELHQCWRVYRSS